MNCVWLCVNVLLAWMLAWLVYLLNCGLQERQDLIDNTDDDIDYNTGSGDEHSIGSDESVTEVFNGSILIKFYCPLFALVRFLPYKVILV